MHFPSYFDKLLIKKQDMLKKTNTFYIYFKNKTSLNVYFHSEVKRGLFWDDNI